MKIATITNSIPQSNIYANPVYFWLRSFLDCVYPENKVEWVYNVFAFQDLDDMVNKVLSKNPDIILLSIFIFNQGETEAIIKRIRELSLTVKIVLGGPQVNGRTPLVNFDSWADVNAVVYGDGEEALLELVKRWEETGKLSSGINCAVPGDAGTYKRFRWEEWPPYTNFAGTLYEEWRAASEEILIHWGSDRDGHRSVQWPSETDRGCPYGCTFCDWSAGLHHKLTIRPLEAVYADIDAFVGTEDIIFFNNANFFQLKRDLDIVDYLNEKQVIYKITSTSKLQKERVYKYYKDNEQRIQEMYDSGHLAGTNGIGRISLQSIKLEALQAINRPEVPWEEHKKYIQDYRAVRRHDLEIAAEIINDIPLMTDMDWLWQTLEMNDAGIDTVLFQNWEFLPNSPANDPDYLDKWNLLLIDMITVGALDCIKNTRQPDYSKINYKTSYQSKIVVDRTRKYPNSFAHVISMLMNWCYQNKKDFKKEVSSKLDFMISLSQIIDKQVKNQYTPTGQLLYGLYDPISKQFVDVDTWIKQYFSLYEKSPKSPIAKHVHRDTMHELVKQYVPYHKYTSLMKQAS
jgi:hypothetical protein